MAAIVSDNTYAVAAQHVIGLEKSGDTTLVIHLGPAGGLAASVMATVNYKFETPGKRNQFYDALIAAMNSL